MKVAIYTIAKDEESFVERWYNSAKDADYLLIADTGSSDDTVSIAKSLGIKVVSIDINPWRFEDARNAALAFLPKDIDMCISLDMDEVIKENWRKPLEEAFNSGITRPRYKHVWSWKKDGTPDLEFGYDHIHTRHGYRWKHPVHETLYPYGNFEEKIGFVSGLETYHYPDHQKSRGQYLLLLKMSIVEDSQNERNSYYYARELFFHDEKTQSAEEFKRYLSLPTATWAAERSSALRYLAKCEPENAEKYLSEACTTAPDRREPIVELAYFAYLKNNWKLCYSNSIKAITIKEKPLDYLCEEFAWGSAPFDLAAISAYNLEKYEDAIKYNLIALELSPKDSRLIKNMYHYQQAIK